MRNVLLPVEKAGFGRQAATGKVPPDLSLRVDCNAAAITDFSRAPSKKTRALRGQGGRPAQHAKLAIIPTHEPRFKRMYPLHQWLDVPQGALRTPRMALTCAIAILFFAAGTLGAQDNPLDKVHVKPPGTDTPATGAPTGVDAPAATAAGRARPGSLIKMNVDMVLVPVTVTDPMNRLVTGLEKEDFQVYENNGQQGIKSFASEDAPVSIGIVFDLSGSMSSKLIRAREAILQFIKTANPEDEFFVIGFNDRPELIEDFTSSVEDIQARLATVRSGHRTALLDAIYYGVDKMKEAKHERKALLVVSDGGDNRSRYTEGEVRAQVRESDVEIYSIGIFDPYAATPEERTGPILLNDLCEETGGRLFRVDDVSEMGDIAEKISTELRNQYVIGYTPKNISRDGKWRKVKVRLNPPAGLPPLTVHARTGYYAPLQ
jgi:Ca-activated chloride channel homolog